MNKIYRIVFLCLIWIYGYGAEPSSVLPQEDFSATFVQDSKDLLPPKNSDRYLEIKGLKVIVWYVKKQGGKDRNDLKQFRGDVKLGIDRFELLIYNNELPQKDVLTALMFIKGSFEFIKQKPTQTDVVEYTGTNSGSTVKIKFSLLRDKVLSISMTVNDNKEFIGLNI